MNFDIILVTYNSKKWISNNIDSIMKSDFDLKRVNLYYIDNGSSDETIEILQSKKSLYADSLESFTIITNETNVGFGMANNSAAKIGSSDIVFFLNIDTEVYPYTFKKLEAEIRESWNTFDAWELCQYPYEHPKNYDVMSKEVSWASGACFVVKRAVFEAVGGFDKRIFMYGEDVDISWNIRSNGYKIKYLPHVPVTHYSYETGNEFKPTQYIYSLLGNLYIRHKYGNIKNMIKGHYLIIKVLKSNDLELQIGRKESKRIKSQVLKKYLACFGKLCGAIKDNCRLRKNRSNNFKPKFIDFDYEVIRDGAFYEGEPLIDGPLVSVIVRTHDRPMVLKETIDSILNQTYRNIEIIIVEDGEANAETLIKQEYATIKNIKYFATKEKVGRCRTANIGLEKCTGKYINFLDDDDLFYEDHVSVLVRELEKHQYKVAYTTAFETPITVHSKDPYKYEIEGYSIEHKGEFNRVKLFKHNITPIQSVMFARETYNEIGGFDENLETLEDWDFWVRMALNEDFLYIEKTTSLYRVPRDRAIAQKRQKQLDDSMLYLSKKFKNYRFTITVNDIMNLE